MNAQITESCPSMVVGKDSFTTHGYAPLGNAMVAIGGSYAGYHARRLKEEGFNSPAQVCSLAKRVIQIGVGCVFAVLGYYVVCNDVAHTPLSGRSCSS